MVVEIFVLITISSFLVNYFNAKYIDNVGSGNRLKASIYGELVQLAAAGTVYNYARNFWYVVPLVLGGFLGTYFYKKS